MTLGTSLDVFATLAIYRALGRHIYVEYAFLTVILVTSLDVHRHVSYKECKHLGTYIAMTNVSVKLLKMVISLLIDIPNTWTVIQLRPIWI